jgi:DNA-binding YbaB/EbfC family protein
MPQPPNLNALLQQAQEMERQMREAQEQLKQEKVEASAGGGMVKVTATGEGRLEAVTIDPDAVDPDDVEMLQDLLLAATNEALRQVDELRDRAMGGASGFDPSQALDMLGGLGGGGLGGLGGALGGGGGGGAPMNRAQRRKQR